MYSARKNHQPKKIILIILLSVLVIAGTFLVLEKLQIIDLINKKAPSSTSEDKTTSTTKTAQEDFTGADEREPGNSLNENKGSGGIADNNGTISNGTDTTNPIISSTGEITIYAPRQKADVKSGDEISGASTLQKVSYRIIDDVSGVIATGTLQVVNGKFSGKLSYVSTAKEGRLDIFGTRSDGVEYSNVTVSIGLN